MQYERRLFAVVPVQRRTYGRDVLAQCRKKSSSVEVKVAFWGQKAQLIINPVIHNESTAFPAVHRSTCDEGLLRRPHPNYSTMSSLTKIAL